MKIKKLAPKAAAQAKVDQAAEWARRKRLHDDYRAALDAEVVALPSGVARDTLLDSAAASYLEIKLCNEKLERGRAHQKSLQRAALARSELRRTLRCLGLIADAGEVTNGDSAPPANASEEQRREWSERYVAEKSAAQ